MRRDSWRAILAAQTDVDRMVAVAFGGHPQRAPVEPAGSSATPFQTPAWNDPGASEEVAGGAMRITAIEETVSGQTRRSLGRVAEMERRGLQDLHQWVVGRLETLRQQLAHEQGREQAMLALIYYFDERIMTQLPEYLRMAWPLLQIEHTGQRIGGDLFYQDIDDLRRDPSTPSFVFEVYYFCLSNGFIGRYANEPASIERYEQWLQESITLAEVPPDSADSADTAEIDTGDERPMPAWAAYAVALVAVVLLTALLTLLSNYFMTPSGDNGAQARGPARSRMEGPTDEATSGRDEPTAGDAGSTAGDDPPAP
ncbi:MAG: DotU family type IV/VI secretion system protein [Myxococcota bacterium]